MRLFLLQTFFITLSLGVMAQVSGVIELPERVQPEQEFKVSVNVNKSGISGFAKLDQLIPPGFKVVENELASSSYRYKDGKAKFIWMSLPDSDEFTVSYMLTPESGLEGAQIIEGTFSYIDGTDTKEYKLPKAIVLVSADAMASSFSGKESNSSYDRTTNVNATEREMNTVGKARTERSSSELEREGGASSAVVKKSGGAQSSQQENAVRVSDAYRQVEGLVYRVQVLAGYDLRDAESVATKYGIPQDLMVAEHDGMYKYVITREFNQYRAAKALSNELRNTTSLPGPFVVAYKDGYRITTAEALNLLTENFKQLEQIIKDKTSQIGQ